MILLVVGCQKEDIRPNTLHQTSSDSDNEKALRNGGSNDDDDNGKPGDLITDPNHDEDEDDKTKR